MIVKVCVVGPGMCNSGGFGVHLRSQRCSLEERQSVKPQEHALDGLRIFQLLAADHMSHTHGCDGNDNSEGA